MRWPWALLLLLLSDHAGAEPNAEIQLAGMESIQECPEYLEARHVLRMYPKGQRDEVVDEYGEEAQACDYQNLEAALLPSGDGILLRLHYGAVEASFSVVLRDGSQTRPLHFKERSPGAMVGDIAGDDRPEVIIPVIKGTALSSYPTEWRLFRLDKKRLRPMGKVAKEHAYGSKTLEYGFENRITFPEKNRMRVETVRHSGFPFDRPCPLRGVPKRKGDLAEYEFRGGRFKKVSFTKGPMNPEHLEPLAFKLQIHIASNDYDAAKEKLKTKLEAVNEKYQGAAIRFEGAGEPRQLTESFNTIENIPERHKLKKQLVDGAINIFIVDEVLDPNPSASTKKAAKAQGRKPSGRLAGAHIEAKKHKPATYIILINRASGLSMAHELGHFFGLPHTKDPENIMSYGTKRKSFSNEQLEIIRRKAEKYVRKKILENLDG